MKDRDTRARQHTRKRRAGREQIRGKSLPYQDSQRAPDTIEEENEKQRKRNENWHDKRKKTAQIRKGKIKGKRCPVERSVERRRMATRTMLGKKERHKGWV